MICLLADQNAGLLLRAGVHLQVPPPADHHDTALLY